MERKFFVIAGLTTVLLVLALTYRVVPLPDESSQATASAVLANPSSSGPTLSKTTTHAGRVIDLVTLAEMIPAYPLSAPEKNAPLQWGIKLLKNILPWESRSRPDHPVQAVLLGSQASGRDFVPHELIFFISKNVGHFSGERWRIHASGGEKPDMTAKLAADTEQNNNGLLDPDATKNNASLVGMDTTAESFAFEYILGQLQSIPEMQKHLNRYHSGEISTVELNKILSPVVASGKKQAELAWQNRPGDVQVSTLTGAPTL